MENFLIESPINLDIINTELKKIENLKNAGGQVFFLGTVRADLIENKKVKSIFYSAYEDMANQEFYNIKQQILGKYSDIQKIVILHSLGEVKVGQNSLFVIISGGHRKQSFDAMPEIVNLIKENVPIWKKEIFEDDSHTWKE